MIISDQIQVTLSRNQLNIDLVENINLLFSKYTSISIYLPINQGSF